MPTETKLALGWAWGDGSAVGPATEQPWAAAFQAKGAVLSRVKAPHDECWEWEDAGSLDATAALLDYVRDVAARCRHLWPMPEACSLVLEYLGDVAQARVAYEGAMAQLRLKQLDPMYQSDQGKAVLYATGKAMQAFWPLVADPHVDEDMTDPDSLLVMALPYWAAKAGHAAAQALCSSRDLAPTSTEWRSLHTLSEGLFNKQMIQAWEARPQ